MKKQVLVVDDDEDVRLSLELWLQERFDVVTATNGAMAIAALATHHFDAIVLDLMMPVMDGVACKEELDRRGVHIPVIVLSARPNVKEQAAALDAAAYLMKPFDPQVLEHLLERLVEPSCAW